MPTQGSLPLWLQAHESWNLQQILGQVLEQCVVQGGAGWLVLMSRGELHVCEHFLPSPELGPQGSCGALLGPDLVSAWTGGLCPEPFPSGADHVRVDLGALRKLGSVGCWLRGYTGGEGCSLRGWASTWEHAFLMPRPRVAFTRARGTLSRCRLLLSAPFRSPSQRSQAFSSSQGGVPAPDLAVDQVCSPSLGGSHCF